METTRELSEGLDRFHFLMNSGHLEDARVEIYKVASRCNQSFVWKNLYWLEVKRSSEEGQIYAARKLVDIEESSANQFLLAKAFVRSGSDKEALSVCHNILDSYREDDGIIFLVFKMMGSIYQRANDFEAAEEYYNKAYAINSTDIDVQISIGYLYLQNQKMDLAREKFSNILLTNETILEARIGLALIHSNLGEYEVACANLAAVLDLNPGHALALSLYTKWSNHCADGTYPQTYLDQYLKDHPSDDSVLTLMLSWLVENQRYEKANELMPRLKKNYQGNPKHLIEVEKCLRNIL
ncbi:MAG: tetratricopeptide repeat protein [Bdellovibrionaceae bacterium]|nr:tetratricopeptide repeat protein [Pseudobdellovibrionaceae bacterium]